MNNETKKRKKNFRSIRRRCHRSPPSSPASPLADAAQLAATDTVEFNPHRPPPSVLPPPLLPSPASLFPCSPARPYDPTPPLSTRLSTAAGLGPTPMKLRPMSSSAGLFPWPRLLEFVVIELYLANLRMGYHLPATTSSASLLCCCCLPAHWDCVVFLSQVQPHCLLWRGQRCSWLLLCRFLPPYFVFKPVFLGLEFMPSVVASIYTLLDIMKCMVVCEIYTCLRQTYILMLWASLLPFPFSQWYLHACVWYMMLCNYGWVHLSKSIALTFLFRNLFEDLSIKYCSALMLINYCHILTLDTYCPVFMLCKVFTDAAHFNWNAFLNQCFLRYWQRWSSVYLDDKILSLVIVFGLTRRIIGKDQMRRC